MDSVPVATDPPSVNVSAAAEMYVPSDLSVRNVTVALLPDVPLTADVTEARYVPGPAAPVVEVVPTA